MIIGDFNQLTIGRLSKIGAFLNIDDSEDEVLLPTRYVPDNAEPGDELDVFIYLDSEDRLIATTEQPRARVNHLAFLPVVDQSAPGAFLDWGLPKDLLVPQKEQAEPMVIGSSYLVFVYLDQLTKRLAASTRLTKYMSERPENLQSGDAVKVWVWRKHDLGFQVIVDDEYVGMLYNDQLHQEVRVGQKMDAFVNQVREDGKIDVLLQAPGYGAVNDAATDIFQKLNDAGGHLPLTDKSPPDVIKRKLAVSKKVFKKAIGQLYKQKLITIDSDGIRKNK